MYRNSLSFKVPLFLSFFLAIFREAGPDSEGASSQGTSKGTRWLDQAWSAFLLVVLLLLLLLKSKVRISTVWWTDVARNGKTGSFPGKARQY